MEKDNCVAINDEIKTLIIALGAGIAIWGILLLREGYGNDNPKAKERGMKFLEAGGKIAAIGEQPLLAYHYSDII